MVTKQIMILMYALSWAWAGTGFAKVYKLTSQHENEVVKMRDPIMPGDSADHAKMDFSKTSELESKELNVQKSPKKSKRITTGNKKQLTRKLPKHTKTQEKPGQLRFSTYAIGGRLDHPRVEFSLEPLPLPTSEEPVQIDYKEKLREMGTQKELGL